MPERCGVNVCKHYVFCFKCSPDLVFVGFEIVLSMHNINAMQLKMN